MHARTMPLTGMHSNQMPHVLVCATERVYVSCHANGLSRGCLLGVQSAEGEPRTGSETPSAHSVGDDTVEGAIQELLRRQRAAAAASAAAPGAAAQPAAPPLPTTIKPAMSDSAAGPSSQPGALAAGVQTRQAAARGTHQTVVTPQQQVIGMRLQFL